MANKEQLTAHTFKIIADIALEFCDGDCEKARKYIFRIIYEDGLALPRIFPNPKEEI